jgi:hypothetical protein
MVSIVLSFSGRPERGGRENAVADGPQLCWQMQLHKITGNVRLRQELPERGIVGSGSTVFPAFIFPV